MLQKVLDLLGEARTEIEWLKDMLLEQRDVINKQQ